MSGERIVLAGDVDSAAARLVHSARRLDPQLAGAIGAVGQRHDLRNGRRNDAAAGFRPSWGSVRRCWRRGGHGADVGLGQVEGAFELGADGAVEEV